MNVIQRRKSIVYWIVPKLKYKLWKCGQNNALFEPQCLHLKDGDDRRFDESLVKCDLQNA